MSQANAPCNAPPARWPLVWVTLLALLALADLGVFVPWTATLPSFELDASWCMVLHWAQVHHLDFGNQIVFTYGPWGFMVVNDEPANTPYVAGGWALLGAGFFAGIFQLSRRLTRGRWLGLAWMAAVTALAGSLQWQGEDILLFCPSWVLLILHFHADRRPLTGSKVLLILAAALASLVKISALAMALPMAAAITADLIFRRRVPWLAVIYVGAVLASWLAAGQRLDSFPAYLRHGWNIASGYGQGESLWTATEAGDVFWFALAAGGVLAAAALGGRSRLSAGALALVLLLLFKTGYVRHDAHEVIATTGLGVLALLYGAGLWAALRHWAAKALLAGVVAGCLCLVWHSDKLRTSVGLCQHLLRELKALKSTPEATAQWALGDANEDRQSLRRLWQRTPLPRPSGSVDSYSWHQNLLLADGLDYRPRPVFQSYLTYTPELARLNAQFLDSPQAPQNILLHIEPIDQHYPAQEDALSWPLLLSRYEVKDAGGLWLVLRRAERARGVCIVPLEQTTAHLGDWVSAAAWPDALWATLDLKLTALGEVLGAVYKPPRVMLDIQTRSGRTETFRLIPAVARGGFLLSPLVADDRSFAMLYSSNVGQSLGNAQVTRLRVYVAEGFGSSWAYRRQYRITFSRLVLPHR